MYKALSFPLVVTDIVCWIFDRAKGDALATDTQDYIKGAVQLIELTGIMCMLKDFPALMPNEVVGVVL